MPQLCTTLLLGVTGSIAAADTPALVRRLRRDVAPEVHVILTRAARRFVVPRAVALTSGHPVLSGVFDEAEGMSVPHIELARLARLILVAPATAHVLARCAHGLCDDLLTTTIVASRAPVVFAPNMNDAMWESPVVQRNVRILRELGHHVIEPTVGIEVADGVLSFGAMPPADELVKVLGEVLARRREATHAPG